MFGMMTFEKTSCYDSGNFQRYGGGFVNNIAVMNSTNIRKTTSDAICVTFNIFDLMESNLRITYATIY